MRDFALTFHPHPLFRNPHLQTIVSSLGRGQAPHLEQAAQELILDAGEGIRLQCYYSPQPDGRPKAVVLLLHGWLGSARSNYILTLGEYLYRRGYAIFRLNLRDHGGTHRLNAAPFRSDLLEEVFVATQSIAELAGDRPLHLVGVSLGGNFALRLVWRHRQTPLPNLGRALAICPVINPYHTTLALDRGPYLLYFRRKWRRALRQKQAAFGELDFAGAITATTCLAMTEAFVSGHSPYPNAQAYFDRYTITPEMITGLRRPVTILATADDPIIPAGDFASLYNLNPRLQLYLQPYGGHVGFIDRFPRRSWLPSAVMALLENER
ncbi:MAG: alpha/beta fold hydrolase [Chloroflexota bacterium]